MRCLAHGSGGPVAPYFTEFVEGRRGEVLDAALCVFAEKGYEGGTMREIARRLGVTEPALYRHYAGKEALFEDLVAVAGGRVAGQVRQALEELRPEALRATLVAVLDARRTNAPRNEAARAVMRTLLTAAPHNAAFREVFREHVGRPMLAALEAFVPRVDAHRGITRTADERAAALRALLSLIVGYFMTALMLELPDDDEAIVDGILAVMGWSDRDA